MKKKLWRYAKCYFKYSSLDRPLLFSFNMISFCNLNVNAWTSFLKPFPVGKVKNWRILSCLNGVRIWTRKFTLNGGKEFSAIASFIKLPSSAQVKLNTTVQWKERIWHLIQICLIGSIYIYRSFYLSVLTVAQESLKKLNRSNPGHVISNDHLISNERVILAMFCRLFKTTFLHSFCYINFF